MAMPHQQAREALVDHDVQVVVLAARRAARFRDVPRPHVIRLPGNEVGFLARLVPGLGAPLPDLPLGPQHPVRRRYRRQVGALVQQRRPHLARRLVGELAAVEDLDELSALLARQRVRWRHLLDWFDTDYLRFLSTIVAGPVDSSEPARRLDSEVFLQLLPGAVLELGYEFSESALSDIESKLVLRREVLALRQASPRPTSPNVMVRHRHSLLHQSSPYSCHFGNFIPFCLT